MAPSPLELAEDFTLHLPPRRVLLVEQPAAAQEQRAVHYPGYLDGEPVSQARAFFLENAVMLLGGASLPRAAGTPRRIGEIRLLVDGLAR